VMEIAMAILTVIVLVVPVWMMSWEEYEDYKMNRDRHKKDATP
jgi:hypothetical protein